MTSRAPEFASRPDGRATRWAGHREQRRREMVEVAILVIERDGPAASVDQIAAEIGVGRQVLYRQFDDRADLDRAIAERVVALVLEQVPAHDATPADPDAETRNGLRAYLGHVEAHPQLYRFIRAYDTAREGADDPLGPVKDLLAARIAGESGQAAAQPVDRLVATGLVGLCNAVVDDWLNGRLQLPRDVVLQQLARMLTGVGRGGQLHPSTPEPRSSPEDGR